ncbi:MAG: serine/threonine-protein kinase [Agriterribacter sp.]
MLLFNRYEYNPNTDLVGRGSFSRVYKAMDKKKDDWVALKLYKSTSVHPKALSPILAQQLLSLNHPHIQPYIAIEEIEKEDAFGETERIQVYINKLAVQGNTISFFEENKNLITLKKVLADAVKGLRYLHDNNIIHKQVRPSNILVDGLPDAPIGKICDFGINHHSLTDTSETDFAASLTVAIPYLAPEQLNPQQYGIDEKISSNIDVWLLGLTVYEIITGEMLFKNSKRESGEQVMKKILNPTLPESINAVPEPFKTFIQTCLVKDAKLRIKNVDALLDILEPSEKEEKKTFNTLEETDADTKALKILPQDVLQSDPVSITNILTPIKTDDSTQVISNNFSDTSLLNEAILVNNATAGIAINTDTQVIAPPIIKITATDDTSILSENKSANNDVYDTAPINQPIKEGSIVLFNRYEYLPVTDLIGKGGFSRVYKAYDKKLNRWVALKIYKTNDLSDRYSPFAEIRRVINLDHANICRYLDIEEMENINPFGETEKIQVCVMELLDSGNIAEYYKAHPDTAILKKLLMDVLNGLSYLHKKGIIHRDIKPANILIKESIEGPVAKITDFGISKASDTVNNNSSSALIVSIPFMAPEQFNTKKYGIDEKISFNLDLWSLGVTIYEVYTGKVLFKDNDQDNSEQIMANIMAPELPDKINRLPEPFKKVVAHCLIKSAKDRAQKAEELMPLLNEHNDKPKAIYFDPNSNEGEIQKIKPIIADDITETKTENQNLSSGNKSKTHFNFDSTIEEKPGKETKRFNYKRGSIIAGGILLLLIYFLFIKNFMKENAISGPAIQKILPHKSKILHPLTLL